MTWDPIRDTTPVARKRHICQLCEWDIPPGTMYRRVDAILDGSSFHSYKAHPVCDAVLMSMHWDAGENGTPEPSIFHDRLRHVGSVEFEAYQLTPTHTVCYKLVMSDPDELGFWDGDSWNHGGLEDDCPRCGR